MIQKTPERVYVLDEQVHLKHLEERCISEIKATCERRKWGAPEMAVYSHERPSLGLRLREEDIPSRSKRYDRLDGVSKVRRLFCDMNGDRTILVHHRCKRLIEELTQLYVYDENVPGDGDDDCCDALRMWVEIRMR